MTFVLFWGLFIVKKNKIKYGTINKCNLVENFVFCDSFLVL